MRNVDGKGKEILVVGDVCLDRHIYLREVRRCPENSATPVTVIQREEFRPGMAAGVATRIVQLGGEAILVGVTGEDAERQTLRDLCNSWHLGLRIVASRYRPTTLKQRHFLNGNLHLRVDREDACPVIGPLQTELLFKVNHLVPQAHAVVLSDYGKGVLTPTVCRHILDLAHFKNIPIHVDSKGPDWSKFRGCTLLQASWQYLPEPLDLDQFPAQLLTDGANGMTLYRMDRPPLHLPARHRPDFQVIGAGDRLAAACALGLASGLGVEEAVREAAEMV